MPTWNTTVAPGQSYPISMQSGSAWGQGFGVWIDYNRDNDFDDAGEFVYASPTSGTNVFNGNVTIPITAIPGTTRMRVRLRIFIHSFSHPILCCPYLGRNRRL